MRAYAEHIVQYLASIVEVIAAVVILMAILRFLVSYTRHFASNEVEHRNTELRIQFGSALSLSLELLLAADILATAFAPTWDDIGKLAAIAALRTALNYFLERELRQSKA
jgi:uncharacterized membrane protein YcaP (DUF421 family)/uncharacterized membrane protein